MEFQLPELKITAEELDWETNVESYKPVSAAFLSTFDKYLNTVEKENIFSEKKPSEYNFILTPQLLETKLNFERAIDLLTFNHWRRTDDLLINCFKYFIRKGDVINAMEKNYWLCFLKLVPIKVRENFYLKTNSFSNEFIKLNLIFSGVVRTSKYR